MKRSLTRLARSFPDVLRISIPPVNGTTQRVNYRMNGGDNCPPFVDAVHTR